MESRVEKTNTSDLIRNSPESPAPSARRAAVAYLVAASLPAWAALPLVTWTGRVPGPGSLLAILENHPQVFHAAYLLAGVPWAFLLGRRAARTGAARRLRWWAAQGALGTLLTGATLALVAVALLPALLPPSARSADLLAVFGNPVLWVMLGFLGLLAGASGWLLAGPVGPDEPPLPEARCLVAYPLCCAALAILILSLTDLPSGALPRLPKLYLLGPLLVPSVCVVALPWALLQLALARRGSRTGLVWWAALSGLGAGLSMVVLGPVGTVGWNEWGNERRAGVLRELFQIVTAAGVAGAAAGALFWWLVPRRAGRRMSASPP